jgi:DNA-binding transcriptional ArsR family regulator
MKSKPGRSQRILACLGDESRFRVVLELMGGDRCVTDLAIRVGLSQSCTTRHLQALEREGLGSSSRAGKRVFFSVSREPRMVALLAWALPSEHDETTPGMPDAATTAIRPTKAPRAGGPKQVEEPQDDLTRTTVPDLEDFLL